MLFAVLRRNNFIRTNSSTATACLLPRLALFWFLTSNHKHRCSAMSTFSTERSSGGTITVTPRNEAQQSALVVISHGLGDSAEGFADVAENLASTMPHVKFVLPTAPTQPVTVNGGMPMPSWYDIVGLDERANENCNGIEESQARLTSILQTEHEKTGLPYNRMILAGFSQGGALSLYTGLQLPQPLAGIVVMSGYIPALKKLKITAAKTPILHCHGTQDPVVPFHLAQKTQQALQQERGVENYTLETYPIPHTVSPAELSRVLKFLQEHLPDADEHKIQLPEPSSMSVKELKVAIARAGLKSKMFGFTEKREFVELLTNIRAGKL